MAKHLARPSPHEPHQARSRAALVARQSHAGTRSVPSDLQQAFKRDRHTCQRCGYVGRQGDGTLHADHIHNRAAGGATSSPTSSHCAGRATTPRPRRSVPPASRLAKRDADSPLNHPASGGGVTSRIKPLSPGDIAPEALYGFPSLHASTLEVDDSVPTLEVTKLPGPVPKRSDQRRRRNQTSATDKAAGAKAVKVPAADRSWHPIAKSLWASLAKSGQADFYEPSDWAFAFSLMDDLSYIKKAQERDERRPAQMLQTVYSALSVCW